jgi:predicted transcriptional regulator
MPLPETPKFVLRLPPDLRAQLQVIADREDRRLTNLIIHALREWLAWQKDREDDDA